MKLDYAPCSTCAVPHTENFCNDGFHTIGSTWKCARYINILDPCIRPWFYTVPCPEDIICPRLYMIV